MQRDLHEKGACPDEEKAPEGRKVKAVGSRARRMFPECNECEQEGGSEFGQHQGGHDPSRAERVGGLIGGEGLPRDFQEERVVDHLNEPDDPGHHGGEGEFDQEERSRGGERGGHRGIISSNQGIVERGTVV